MGTYVEQGIVKLHYKALSFTKKDVRTACVRCLYTFQLVLFFF